MKSLQDIKVEVSAARNEAVRKAESDYICIRSRGTWLNTTNKKEGQCDPQPQGECYEWNGTLKQIKNLIDDVEANHPDCDEIWISGGYDGADSVRDLNDGDYDPWVSDWDVLIWKREAGQDEVVEKPAVTVLCYKENFPTGREGDICFWPRSGRQGGFLVHAKFVLGSDGRWHDQGGDWRKKEDGTYGKIPYWSPMAGYTKDNYKAFLIGHGFKV